MAHLLFATAIEGTFITGLQKKLTPRLRERLAKEAKIDLGKLLPAYEVELFLQAIRVTQEELGLPGDAGERELGSIAFHGFAQTFVGRAVVAFTRLAGPDRTLPRMAKNMKAGVNFMDFTSEKLAPGHYRLSVTEVGGLPHFYGGLFEAGMADSGARGVSVKVASYDGHRCVYDIAWPT